METSKKAEQTVSLKSNISVKGGAQTQKILNYC